MHGTTNRQAFKIYLEAERLFTVVVKEDMALARDKFRLVTELGPNYARAWGWRSYTQVRSVLRGWLPETDMYYAKVWAEKAVFLGPHDFATHWDLAFCLLNHREYPEAIAAYEEGIRLYN